MRFADLCRQNGISDAKRLRQFDEENAQMNRLAGEQALDIVVLQDVITKNF